MADSETGMAQMDAKTTLIASIDMGWSTWLCFHIAHAPKRQRLRFSSLTALEVVKMITSSAAGDGSFVAVMKFTFGCIATEHCQIQIFTWFYNLVNVPSSVVMISPIWVLMYLSIVSVKRTRGIIQSLKRKVVMVTTLCLLASALIFIFEIKGALVSIYVE